MVLSLHYDGQLYPLKIYLLNYYFWYSCQETNTDKISPRLCHMSLSIKYSLCDSTQMCLLGHNPLSLFFNPLITWSFLIFWTPVAVLPGHVGLFRHSSMSASLILCSLSSLGILSLDILSAHILSCHKVLWTWNHCREIFHDHMTWKCSHFTSEILSTHPFWHHFFHGVYSSKMVSLFGSFCPTQLGDKFHEVDTLFGAESLLSSSAHWLIAHYHKLGPEISKHLFLQGSWRQILKWRCGVSVLFEKALKQRPSFLLPSVLGFLGLQLCCAHLWHSCHRAFSLCAFFLCISHLAEDPWEQQMFSC